MAETCLLYVLPMGLNLTHQAFLPTPLQSATSALFPGSRSGPETYFDANEMRAGTYEPVSTGPGRPG